MIRKVTFVIGGAKSGKSSFALDKVSGIEGRKAFIATAEAHDEEMIKRIERHKTERGSEWETYEEPLNIAGVLSEISGRYSVILIDCLTLWLSNAMHRTKDTEGAINEFLEKLNGSTGRSADTAYASEVYIVSNEVGMGIVPGNELARRFRDLAGNLNQKVAGMADEVYLVAAGIPVKIK